MKDSIMMEMIREIKLQTYEEVKDLPLDKQLDEILKSSHVTAEQLGFIFHGK